MGWAGVVPFLPLSASCSGTLSSLPGNAGWSSSIPSLVSGLPLIPSHFHSGRSQSWLLEMQAPEVSCRGGSVVAGQRGSFQTQRGSFQTQISP